MGAQLVKAVKEENEEEVKKILDKVKRKVASLDINEQNREGYTALHYAASSGNVAVLPCLSVMISSYLYCCRL